jgi:hypothetical protein
MQQLRSLDDEGTVRKGFERDTTSFLTDFFVFWIVQLLPQKQPG